MTLAVFSFVVVPAEYSAFTGRFPLAWVIWLFLMTLLLFPFAAVEVENKMVPETVEVLLPSILANCSVSEWAPLIKRTVEVPAVAEVLVLRKVNP